MIQPAVRILVLVLALALPAAALAGPKNETEVKAVLEKLGQAYKARDLEAITALYSPESGVSAIGTERGEAAVGPEAVRKLYATDFAVGPAPESLFLEYMSVYASGHFAWAAASLTATFPSENGPTTVQGRLTAVLRRTGGVWRIVHTHFSLPAAGK